MSQNQRTQQLERELNRRMPDKEVRVIERDDGTVVAGARDPETGEVQTREIDAEQVRSSGGGRPRPTQGPTGSKDDQQSQGRDRTTSEGGGRGRRGDDGEGLGGGDDATAETGGSSQQTREQPPEQSRRREDPKPGTKRRREDPKPGTKRRAEQDGGGGGLVDMATGVVSGVGSGIASTGGNIVGGVRERVRENIETPDLKQRAETNRELFVDPIADFGGDLGETIGRGAALVNPNIDPGADAPRETGEKFGAGVATTVGETANIPGVAVDARRAAEFGAEGVEATASGEGGRIVEIGGGEVDVLEGGFAEERVEEEIESTVETAEENPFRTTGAIAGGLITGVGASRLLRGVRAPGLQQRRVRADDPDADLITGDDLDVSGFETRPDRGVRRGRVELESGMGRPPRGFFDRFDRDAFRRELDQSQERRLGAITPDEDLRDAVEFDQLSLLRRVDDEQGIGGVLGLGAVGEGAAGETDQPTTPDIDQPTTPNIDQPTASDTDQPTTPMFLAPSLTTPGVSGATTTGAPGTPARKSPRPLRLFGDDAEDDMDDMDDGRTVGAASGDAEVAPGFLSETIRDIALLGGATDAEGDLEEEATTADLLTGEVPTEAELFGTEAEQAAIEETGDLFTFGGGSDDDGGGLL